MQKWSLIFLVALSCLCSSRAVEKINIGQPCEIVIILDFSISIAELGYGTTNDIMNVIREIPDYVQLSNTGVRMALIVFADTSSILLHLTADENKIRSMPTPPHAVLTNSHFAFEDAATVLKQSRPNAAKFVILITDGKPTEQGKAEAAADKLWKSGATIFVGFVGNDYYNPDVKHHIDNKIARDRKRVLPYKDIRMFLENIKNELPRLIFCDNAEQICSFDQNGKCMWSWWSVYDSNMNCDDPSSRPKRPCHDSECEKTCSRWPWEEKSCNDVNTGTVTIFRRGPRPQQRLYEFCPTTKTTVCPPKRTTSTTQRPTSTRTTTTTKRTTTTTKRTTTTTKRTTTAKPIRPPPPKKTLKPNEGPDATVSMMGVSNGRPGLTTAGSGGQDGVRPESKSRFWGWAIALIILIVLLLLLLLLVALVVSRRRRRAAKQRHHGKPRHGVPPRSPRHGSRNGQNVFPTGKQPARSGSHDSRPPHYLSHGPRANGQPSGLSFDGAYGRGHNVKKADKSAGVSLPSLQQKQSRGQAPAKSFQTSWGPKGKSNSAGVSLPTMQPKKQSRGQSPSRRPALGPSFQKPYDRGLKGKKADKSAGVSLASTPQKKQSRGQSPSRRPAPGLSFRKPYDRGPKGKKAEKSAGVSLASMAGKKKVGKMRK